MRNLSALYWLIAIQLSLINRASCEQLPSLEGERPLANNSYAGRASIHVQQSRIAPGYTVVLDTRFVNEGEGQQFYNPFFRTMFPPPAALAVFDAKKHFVGELIEPMQGSFPGPHEECWVFIPHNGYVGTTLEFEMRVPGILDSERLPPGKYFLQIIFHSRFASGNPFRNSKDIEQRREDRRGWEEKYRSPDLFRSNVVEIELLGDEAGVDRPIPASQQSLRQPTGEGRSADMAEAYAGFAQDRALLHKTMSPPYGGNGKVSSPESRGAAQRIFRTISFIDKTRDEVWQLLGDPATVSDFGVAAKPGPDSPLVYRFETGLAGQEYRIEFRANRVWRVTVTNGGM